MALHEQAVGLTNEWYTPPYVFDAMGAAFDVDVASPGRRLTPWIPAKSFITAGSLDAAWRGFVWMNPPFGGRNGLVPWLEKFVEHRNGVCLVPDRTSAPWWQQFAPRMHAMLFVARKIKFIGADGKPGTSPAQGTCLMSMGPQGNAALLCAGVSRPGSPLQAGLLISRLESRDPMTKKTQADDPEQLANFARDLNDDAEAQKKAEFKSDPSKPLWPPRRELFAQLMFGGYPATTAYEQAGYVRDSDNARHMHQIPEVRARIVWLMQMQSDRNQRQMARAIVQKAYSEVIALEEAEMVRMAAMSVERYHTALQAIALKARLVGLLKVEGAQDRPLSDMTLDELENSVVGLGDEAAQLQREIRERKLAGAGTPFGTFDGPPDGKIH